MVQEGLGSLTLHKYGSRRFRFFDTNKYRPRPKKYHFLFLLPFDAEAFKTCKNTIKLINLCALPCLGLGLWLTLTVFFDLA